MTSDIAELFLRADLICTFVAGLLYFLLNYRVMGMLSAVVLFINLVALALHSRLLSMESAKFYWYLVWSVFSLSLLFFVLKITKKHPQLQKVTLPISFLLFISILIELARHFERHFSELTVVKSIYAVSAASVNWLILAYLFAPIALLLVKSVRKRFD